MSSQEDYLLTHNIVRKIKADGLFDSIRRDLLQDIEQKPPYIDLKSQVENLISKYLSDTEWDSTLKKSDLREKSRKYVEQSNLIDYVLPSIVSEYMDKSNSTLIQPKISNFVQEYLEQLFGTISNAYHSQMGLPSSYHPSSSQHHHHIPPPSVIPSSTSSPEQEPFTPTASNAPSLKQPHDQMKLINKPKTMQNKSQIKNETGTTGTIAADVPIKKLVQKTTTDVKKSSTIQKMPQIKKQVSLEKKKEEKKITSSTVVKKDDKKIKQKEVPSKQTVTEDRNPVSSSSSSTISSPEDSNGRQELLRSSISTSKEPKKVHKSPVKNQSSAKTELKTTAASPPLKTVRNPTVEEQSPSSSPVIESPPLSIVRIASPIREIPSTAVPSVSVPNTPVKQETVDETTAASISRKRQRQPERLQKDEKNENEKQQRKKKKKLSDDANNDKEEGEQKLAVDADSEKQDGEKVILKIKKSRVVSPCVALGDNVENEKEQSAKTDENVPNDMNVDIKTSSKEPNVVTPSLSIPSTSSILPIQPQKSQNDNEEKTPRRLRPRRPNPKYSKEDFEVVNVHTTTDQAPAVAIGKHRLSSKSSKEKIENGADSSLDSMPVMSTKKTSKQQQQSPHKHHSTNNITTSLSEPTLLPLHRVSSSKSTTSSINEDEVPLKINESGEMSPEYGTSESAFVTSENENVNDVTLNKEQQQTTPTNETDKEETLSLTYKPSENEETKSDKKRSSSPRRLRPRNQKSVTSTNDEAAIPPPPPPPITTTAKTDEPFPTNSELPSVPNKKYQRRRTTVGLRDSTQPIILFDCITPSPPIARDNSTDSQQSSTSRKSCQPSAITTPDQTMSDPPIRSVPVPDNLSIQRATTFSSDETSRSSSPNILNEQQSQAAINTLRSKPSKSFIWKPKISK